MLFFFSQKVSAESTRGWDVFRNPPPKIDSGSMANQQCLDITMQVLKVLAYLFTFVIVLASGVIAKGTLLLMTSQLREDRVVTYCNKKLGELSELRKSQNQNSTSSSRNSDCKRLGILRTFYTSVILEVRSSNMCLFKFADFSSKNRR